MRIPSPALRAQLVSALIDWLEVERTSLAKSWEKEELPPVVSVDRVLAKRTYLRIAERQATWYLEFKPQKVEVSRFSFAQGMSMFWNPTSLPPVDLLAQAYGEECIDGKLLDEKADHLSARFAPFVGRLCGDYFSNLTLVTSPEADVAVRVIENYLRFLEAEEVVEVVQVPIGGIMAPDEPIEARDVGICIRALTTEELGELNKDFLGLRTMLEPSVLPLGMRGMQQEQLGLESSMLTVSERRPRLGTKKPSRRAHRVILAMQLLGYSICGRGAIASWTEPGPRMGELEKSPVMPRMPNGPEVPLPLPDIHLAAEIAARIPEGCFDKPGRRDEIVLRRFSIAAAQEDEAEALIDYVIALEGLLVPGAQTEVSFRLCLNGARYLPDAVDQRSPVFRELKKLYDIRSKLVHGAGAQTIEDDTNWKRKARDLAARGLRKAVLGGWPNAEDFAVAALS